MDRDYYRLVAGIEDRHWWYVGRRRILAAVLEGLDLPEDARVLDVGCGTGGNLPMLSHFGRLSAVETDSYARGIAAARGVCEIVEGSLPGAIPLEPSSCDLVTALDVIEHISDEEGALADLHRLLAPGGFLVVTVPAYMFLWSQHDVTNHHVRRYTRRRLTDGLRVAGFEITHATYFNTLLFPAVAAARLVGRVTPARGRDDMRLPARAVNRALGRIFASEARLVPDHSLPFGVSILGVARRS